jgi:dipeptidyl aminopeptidase/acylaminoacyl peptidase
VPFSGGSGRAFVHGDVEVSAPAFTPDGRFVTYLARRGDGAKRGLWAIPVDGGESRKLLAHAEDISTYRISPDGARLAFVARGQRHKQRRRAQDKGYREEVVEEDWEPQRAWIADLPPFEPVEPVAADPASNAPPPAAPRPIDAEGDVLAVEWVPGGRRLVLAVSPGSSIDDRTMRQRLRVVAVDTGAVSARIDNPGKLGAFEVSPDGRHLALISAADPADPREGRLMVASIDGGVPVDVMPGLLGHVSRAAWRDARTVAFVADEGTATSFGEVDVESGRRTIRLAAASGGTVLEDFRAAFSGHSPAHPAELFTLGPGERAPSRRTDSNPWLGGVRLAPQEVVRWKARDGLDLEGILIRPLTPAAGTPAPLLLMVHGGPEAHDGDGWVTSYSRPGQVAAALGYLVLYPNYRGSTGRGVAFSKLGQADAAGREFDDLVDAVDHLVAAGLADRDRVGITGGSYGGYATAWCATRHTERFRAGVMFVGISNVLTQGLTTDIPGENVAVHTLQDPWTRWEFSLERSPLRWVEGSRTALLIAGGTDDTRVDPGQSLQLYRALKLLGRTPVRYVQEHGNRRAAARDDYARRLVAWMDHFVRDRGTGLPAWEVERDLGDDEERDEAPEAASEAR